MVILLDCGVDNDGVAHLSRLDRLKFLHIRGHLSDAEHVMLYPSFVHLCCLLVSWFHSQENGLSDASALATIHSAHIMQLDVSGLIWLEYVKHCTCSFTHRVFLFADNTIGAEGIAALANLHALQCLICERCVEVSKI